MFGTYRLYLALCVASIHFGAADFIGCYAVFGFFVLSGYLMSLTLNKRYLSLPYGRLRFLLNRAMRIYPLYWLTVLMAALYAAYVPTSENIFMPHTLLHWIQNITTIGMVSLDGAYHIPNLNSVAWSLSSEIIFWCVLAVLWPSRLRVYLFFAVAVGYTAYLMLANGVYNFPIRYNNPLSAALPFAVGAGVYLLKEKGIIISSRVGAPLLVITLLAMTVGDKVFYNIILDGWYGVMLLNALVIFYLAGIKPKAGWPEKLDRGCGDLSYPFFISHWLVGVVLKTHVITTIPPRSWEFFICLVPITLAVAALLHYAVVRPIESWRRSVRKA